MRNVLGRAVAHRLFWPLAMLVALLAINVVAVPGFLSITINSEGHLFGSLIDILRNGAPTLMIAVGMTLVIAYLSLVLGELVPKRLAMQNAVKLATAVGPILNGFAVPP